MLLKSMTDFVSSIFFHPFKLEYFHLIKITFGISNYVYLYTYIQSMRCIKKSNRIKNLQKYHRQNIFMVREKRFQSLYENVISEKLASEFDCFFIFLCRWFFFRISCSCLLFFSVPFNKYHLNGSTFSLRIPIQPLSKCFSLLIQLENWPFFRICS